MAPEILTDMLEKAAVSPYEEMLAYEYLYSKDGSTLKKMTEATVLAHKLPTEALADAYGMIEPDDMDAIADFLSMKLDGFAVAVNNTTTWPDKLSDSARPTPLFYYRGDIGLLDSKSVSIVGSRKASAEGVARASKLARQMAENDVTVVSGLARGIDTAATKAALDSDGNTIGVIGTPIDEYYPAENRELQDRVAKDGLLISQVPLYRYAHQSFNTKRFYFPERNELMAAVSDATVIVEASDTSGTLTQARACMHQNRPLFIMRSCVESNEVTWPRKWIGRNNVYILDDASQILDILNVEEG